MNSCDFWNAESWSEAKWGWSDCLSHETRRSNCRRRSTEPVNLLRHRLRDRLGRQRDIRDRTQRARIDRRSIGKTKWELKPSESRRGKAGRQGIRSEKRLHHVIAPS